MAALSVRRWVARPLLTSPWLICALLFFATTINYIDRQILGLLKPTLATEFKWSDSDYADILICFQSAYALGLLGFGRLVDRIGSRRGLAIAVAVWSAAAALHAGAGAKLHFALARIGLGVGESGCFPASIKVVAERFQPHQRALATGILNAGTSVGAVTAPLAVPLLVTTYGWRIAFLVTGLLGGVWLIAWLWVTGVEQPQPMKVISADVAAPHDLRVKWSTLLRQPVVWAFMTAKFLTDPVWSLFLNWLPDFFSKTYSLNLVTFGPALVAVYLMADAGSIGGGWLSSKLVARGWPVAAARRRTMLICALGVMPLLLTVGVHNLYLAISAIGLAVAAHQGWSSNLFTLVADTHEPQAVATVVGLGAFTGTLGSILMSRMAGLTLDATDSYVPLFMYASVAYLIALAVLTSVRRR